MGGFWCINPHEMRQVLSDCWDCCKRYCASPVVPIHSLGRPVGCMAGCWPAKANRTCGMCRSETKYLTCLLLFRWPCTSLRKLNFYSTHTHTHVRAHCYWLRPLKAWRSYQTDSVGEVFQTINIAHTHSVSTGAGAMAISKNEFSSAISAPMAWNFAHA